jgi:predicted phage baseplate assembly protein
MANHTEDRVVCPCDLLVFPPKPEIPAGLATLPRQLAGFPEFRAAMLSHIRSHTLLDVDIVPVGQQRPLQDWRAREGDDLGIMLLEMWAYVLDVLAFYEERIANETYLQTAQREISLRRLVELIGYRPRPATAAGVTLALLADAGKGLVSIPTGTAFRSGAFDGEAPQVFETSSDATIDPALNRWTLAPVREAEFAGVQTLAGDAQVDVGDLVLLSWDRDSALVSTVILRENVGTTVALLDADQVGDASFSSGAVTLPSGDAILYGKSAQVSEIRSFEALDGESYQSVALTPVIGVSSGTLLEDVHFQKTILDAGVHAATDITTGIRVTLDSQQTQIRVNDIVLLARDSGPIPFRVTAVTHLEMIQFGEVPVSPDAVQPFTLATMLDLFPRPPAGWDDDVSRLRVHFRLVQAGRLTRPARDRLGLTDLEAGAALQAPVEPPEKDVPGAVQLQGADGHGVEIPATVTVSATGQGTVYPEDEAVPFDTPLRVPVQVFGNLVHATRGETVSNEVLGSGDPTRAFQSFKLKKGPLTWLDDPAGFNGRRSTLQVRVNAILWTEVPSFYGRGAQDEVFIVRQNEKNESIVTFGDGVTGARLPRGVGNITATYRFGAGAAKPPAHSITQIARAVQGLRQVLNPVAAGGGSDADSPGSLRENAPASSLLLGRAVSLADFEALAREFGGVINARATWAWDGRMQRAVVKIWFIADGGDIAGDLRNYLVSQSDPNVPLEAEEAQAIDKALVVDLETEPTHTQAIVEQAVIDALTDETSGLLALKNIPIGGPLFRSRVLGQIHGVTGVVSVRALRFDGAEAGPAMLAGEGEYLDFSSQLAVGNTHHGG